MLSSLDKLSSNLSQDQFRGTRKYLESFYVQQPNQLQTNIMTKGGEEGEAMYDYEDYQNHPYQLPTLSSDQQQQQIEEDLALMIKKKEFNNMNIWTPLNNSKNHNYHPKTPSIAH